jgi:hypothetical protein
MARGINVQRKPLHAQAVSVILFSETTKESEGLSIVDKEKLSAEGTKAESKERKTIARVHDAITRARIRTPRLAAPLSLRDAIGVIVLHFESQTLEILMTDTFVLKIDGRFTENGAFVSSALALIVSEILNASAERGLSSGDVNKLSGHTVLQREENKYCNDQFDNLNMGRRLQRDSPIAATSVDHSKYTLLKLESAGPAESYAWAVIDFLCRNKLDAVKVRLGHTIDIGGDDWLNVDVTDVFTLTQAQEGLRQSWKSVPWRNSFFGQAPCGQIEFYAKNRKCVVYINGGFHVVNGSESDNGFTSWTLTKVLHDILLRSTGKGLSRRDFEGLAGRPVKLLEFTGRQ